ncbi:MAG: acetylxylan esterase [Oscillospiraceae bacterium]|nr:acetylxylan esterase [Oscillospiraceae bacterium]
MVKIDGNRCHEVLIDKMKPELSFDPSKDYGAWREKVREKLLELLGMERIEANACELKMQIERDEQKDGYRLIRFVFESEPSAHVPCYVLIPDTKKEKYPLAICLQGHTTGFHNSIGEKLTEDSKIPPRHHAMGLQAVERGFMALCIEQRAMGERKPKDTLHNCGFAAYNAFQLGRTIIGERIWDVRCAIDLMVNFPQCDLDKILVTGCSGGGTAAFYAGCYDERIKLCAPGYAFCTFRDSILDILHCPCNCIPNAFRFFEMADLSCLIAPRPLVSIAGQKDPIFPIEGSKRAIETAKRIYEVAGAPGKANLYISPGEHLWYEDIAWEGIIENLPW